MKALPGPGKTIRVVWVVANLVLLGLWVFEAGGTNIEDLGEEHGNRVLKLRGKGGEVD